MPEKQKSNNDFTNINMNKTTATRGKGTMAKLEKPQGEQRNLKWFTDRIGCVTGSKRIETYMNNLGNPHALNRLLDELDEELQWSTQQIKDQFELEQSQANAFMRWGTEHEFEAVATYKAIMNVDVIYSPGFKKHEK